MLLDDDQILIKKVLKGSKSAFEELMRKYNRKVFNFVYRMVREEEVAVELTQDLFMKIFTVLQKYNFEYKFSTWLYRICYNLVIDHIRKNQTYIDELDPNISHGHLSESFSREVDDGYDHLAKQELRNYIWNVVDNIPVKYRELILLRYLEGLKYDEIADITELPVGTVKNRIFKAKEIIKLEMVKDGMFDN